MFKALILPLLVSVFIHALIVAMVFITMPDTSYKLKKAAPSYIKAELVTIEKTTTKPKPAPKKQPVLTKKTPVKKPATADDRARKAAQEKAKQLQLAKQRQKKQQEEKARQQREQQKREQQERERQRREEMARELAEAINAENLLQQAETDDEIASSYTSLISAAITENWSRPPSARNNMEVELMLQLVPTGEVVNVSVVKSSGNGAFDRSAEQAVRRAERFPELQNMPPRVFEKYFRRFRLKFRPEDLRL